MLKRPRERPPPCSPRRIQAARYARVSSVTPDKLLARLDALIPTTALVGDANVWSIMILYKKACKPADEPQAPANDLDPGEEGGSP